MAATRWRRRGARSSIPRLGAEPGYVTEGATSAPSCAARGTSMRSRCGSARNASGRRFESTFDAPKHTATTAAYAPIGYSDDRLAANAGLRRDDRSDFQENGASAPTRGCGSATDVVLVTPGTPPEFTKHLNDKAKSASGTPGDADPGQAFERPRGGAPGIRDAVSTPELLRARSSPRLSKRKWLPSQTFRLRASKLQPGAEKPSNVITEDIPRGSASWTRAPTARQRSAGPLRARPGRSRAPSSRCFHERGPRAAQSRRSSPGHNRISSAAHPHATRQPAR